MPDPTTEFFDRLNRRGHEYLMEKVRARVRFDLEHDRQIDHWLLSINQGDLHVSREKGEADAVISADRAFFDHVVSGEERPLTSWLRNELAVEGRFEYLVLLDRLLPERPGARHPGVAARQERRRP